jgi:peroxiredoxin
VAALLYDSPEELSHFQGKYDISYRLLSDPQSAAINQLGLLNTDMEPGTKYYGVPYPGVLLIDANGIVRAKFAELSYKDRPLMSEIISAVEQLTIID